MLKKLFSLFLICYLSCFLSGCQIGWRTPLGVIRNDKTDISVSHSENTLIQIVVLDRAIIDSPSLHETFTSPHLSKTMIYHYEWYSPTHKPEDIIRQLNLDLFNYLKINPPKGKAVNPIRCLYVDKNGIDKIEADKLINQYGDRYVWNNYNDVLQKSEAELMNFAGENHYEKTVVFSINNGYSIIEDNVDGDILVFIERSVEYDSFNLSTLLCLSTLFTFPGRESFYEDFKIQVWNREIGKFLTRTYRFEGTEYFSLLFIPYNLIPGSNHCETGRSTMFYGQVPIPSIYNPISSTINSAVMEMIQEQ